MKSKPGPNTPDETTLTQAAGPGQDQKTPISTSAHTESPDLAPDDEPDDESDDQPNDPQEQPCPKCKGTLAIERDSYGPYVHCLMCGLNIDMSKLAIQRRNLGGQPIINNTDQVGPGHQQVPGRQQDPGRQRDDEDHPDNILVLDDDAVPHPPLYGNQQNNPLSATVTKRLGRGQGRGRTKYA